MADSAEPASPLPPPRFPWRAVFHRTATAVFVIGPTRRLRYANSAWETVTGKTLVKLRGMRISSRKSASPLGQTLAPPPDVWTGRDAHVRRSAPDTDIGPPWWDVSFLPLPDSTGRVLAVLGTLTVIGEPPPRTLARVVSPAIAELRRQHTAAFPLDLFAGAAPSADRLLAQARLAAETRVPVWIVGEPGTGKQTLARAIHHSGPHRDRAFVALECAAIQPYLAEGLLFGKGGLLSGSVGTLFLKYPSALPRDLQARLTRQLSPIAPGSARLICGSTRIAADDVRIGRLIPPFHSEFSVLELRVPPLRERLVDLPRFVNHLLSRFPTPSGKTPQLDGDTLLSLQAHDWPGNLRELADVLGSAGERVGEEPIRREHLPRFVQEKQLYADFPTVPTGEAWTLDAVLEAVETRLIELALAKANGSQTDAAAALGIFRARLFRRIEALGIAKG